MISKKEVCAELQLCKFAGEESVMKDQGGLLGEDKRRQVVGECTVQCTVC